MGVRVMSHVSVTGPSFLLGRDEGWNIRGLSKYGRLGCVDGVEGGGGVGLGRDGTGNNG